jgi:hypothetical protein
MRFSIHSRPWEEKKHPRLNVVALLAERKSYCESGHAARVARDSLRLGSRIVSSMCVILELKLLGEAEAMVEARGGTDGELIGW